jgi:hypothetical protein
MSDPNPAADLRTAAEHIRRFATAPGITPPPWLSMDHGDRIVHDPGHDLDAPIYVVDEPVSNGANGDWIGFMHPGIGLAVAELFDAEAENAEEEGDMFQHTSTSEAAWEIAVAVNASAQIR